MLTVANSTEREALEESFAMGEANSILEGFEPQNDSVYLELRGLVLSGKMTPEEMGNAILERARNRQKALSAA